jgi:hypothetical protein
LLIDCSVLFVKVGGEPLTRHIVAQRNQTDIGHLQINSGPQGWLAGKIQGGLAEEFPASPR